MSSSTELPSRPSAHQLKDGESISVVPLSSQPSYIPELSQLLFSEWSTLYPLENIHSAADLAHSLSSRPPSTLPLTFIALSSSLVLLGTATLDLHDVPASCPYYGVKPWLSSLLVVEGARGSGVGRALAARVEKEAEDRGMGWVWLWTVRSVALYEHWGWAVVERWWFPAKGKKVAIMRKDYSAASSQEAEEAR